MGRRPAKIRPSDVLADPALLAQAIDEGRLGILLTLFRAAQGTPQSEQLGEAILTHHLDHPKRIDHREKWTMISYMNDLGFEMVTLPTGGGDYQSTRVAFERKADDYAPSVFDRRLFKQMSKMKEANEFSFLVVTKRWEDIKHELAERGVSDEVMIGFIASCMASGYPPVFVPTEFDAARLMDKVMRKVNDDRSRVFVPTPKKDTDHEVAKAMLSAVPGLGWRAVNTLMERFGSLGGVAGANLDDLKSVKGIGDKTARRILGVFGSTTP